MSRIKRKINVRTTNGGGSTRVCLFAFVLDEKMFVRSENVNESQNNLTMPNNKCMHMISTRMNMFSIIFNIISVLYVETSGRM